MKKRECSMFNDQFSIFKWEREVEKLIRRESAAYKEQTDSPPPFKGESRHSANQTRTKGDLFHETLAI
jgi:hypothetical protein